MLCEVCEAEEAVGRCKLCGRYACSRHLDPDGICSICRETLCRICNQRLSVGMCLICTRVICKDCSVELQPGIRLCRECYDRLLNDPNYAKYRDYLRRFLKSRTEK